MTRRTNDPARRPPGGRPQSGRLILFGALILAVLGGALVVTRSFGPWESPNFRAPELSVPPILSLVRVADPDPEVIQAIEQVRSEVMRDPRSAGAWGRLGMILLAHGADPGDANRCLAQAEQLNPGEFRWPYFQGITLLERDSAAAVRKLARAAGLAGDLSPIPRLRLAETLLAQGRLAEAAAHFDAVLRHDPASARAMLGLARIAYLESDFQTARSRLAPIISQPFTRKASRTLSAEISYRAGQRADAERTLAEAAGLPEDPPWPDPLMQEVEAMAVGRKHDLSKAIELMRARRLTEAIRLLRDTLEHYPESGRARMLLGVAHNLSKNWAAGEKVLREAAAKSPDAPRVQFNLGAALFGQGRYSEAAACFEKAALGIPDDAMAHFYVGICRIRAGDLAAAEAPLRQAISCKPDFASAHRELGDVLQKQGRAEEATRHVRTALSLESGDPFGQTLPETKIAPPEI